MTEQEKKLSRERLKEKIEQFRLNKEKIEKANKLSKLINLALYLSLGIATILIVIMTFMNESISLDKKYFNKDIKLKLATVIKNNGDLTVIKNLYKNRDLEKPGFTELFNKNSDIDKYNSETVLSEILNDLKSDYYLKSETDTIYLKRLNEIIETHSLVNPFDKLEINQKNDFENLKFKLGDDFKKIYSDINRISDELNNKNQLVNKYLDKSNFSFLISIIALIITIFLSLYQIYQNRKSRTYSILKEILRNENSEIENEETTDEN